MKVAKIRLTGKISVALATVVLGCSSMVSAPEAFAQYNSGKNLQGSASRNTAGLTGTKKFFAEHPKVKSATVGAGVGAGVGAVTGLVTRKGVLRGSALGASTGAGVGLLQSSETMKRHPIMKDMAQGTLVGAGIGLAAHRGHGAGKKTTQAAIAGAAVGLGAGLLKNLQ
ncbi:MAG: hypothetical protein K2X93_05160 [Candidatus Obscuribacterales bacterium]|nr:hypothetical protein [Candidatus Obscuribacterales bacterium]